MQQTVSKLVKPFVNTPEELPPPSDLTLYWQTIETVVEGLNLDTDLDQLGAPAMAKLAPALVGQAAWAMLVPKPTSWDALKIAATARFGLTPERLEE